LFKTIKNRKALTTTTTLYLHQLLGVSGVDPREPANQPVLDRHRQAPGAHAVAMHRAAIVAAAQRATLELYPRPLRLNVS
jgi:nucleoside phosphorylase